MNKTMLPLLLVLSFLWLGLGSWWLSNRLCGASEVLSFSDGGFSLQDGAFSASANRAFTFDRSTKDIVFDREMQEALRQTAIYLAENPDRRLLLDGLYATAEENTTDFENLGLARAAEIRNILLNYNAGDNQITTRASRVDNLSIREDKVLGGVLFSFSDIDDLTEGRDTEWQDESTEVSEVPDNLTFNYESSSFRFSIGAEEEVIIDSWLEYVNAHPGAKVIVEAYAHPVYASDIAMERTRRLARNNRRVLRNYGFASAQVVAVAKGNADPLDTGTDKAARDKNRRIEIYLQQ